MRILTSLLFALLIAAPFGCSTKTAAVYELSPEAAAIAEKLDIDRVLLAQLEAKPLYEFTEQELGVYLAYMQEAEPDLRNRIVHLGRKNLGQPYELYLLGEFPFETYDPLPLYNLQKSDCVVFSEHVYAMALTSDWPSFFALLQRIRYKDGQIGVATRNHYTEADWNVNNSWLVKDVSAELAGDSLQKYTGTFNRSRFLMNRYGVETDIPVERLEVDFVPWERVAEISHLLQNGDFVNVIVGRDGHAPYATHVGLIAIADDGTVNFLHSTPPAVREEPLATYIQRGVDRIEERKEAERPYLRGFKFLRLQENPLANLRRIDGDETPRLKAPHGSGLALGATR